MRIKEQETRLILPEHDDDDEMAVVSCRRADCYFLFVKQEGNESCFRTSELMLNVGGVFVKMCTCTHEAFLCLIPIVPEAIETHEGNDQWPVILHTELLGEGKISLSAINIKCNIRNASKAISR